MQVLLLSGTQNWHLSRLGACDIMFTILVIGSYWIYTVSGSMLFKGFSNCRKLHLSCLMSYRSLSPTQSCARRNSWVNRWRTSNRGGWKYEFDEQSPTKASQTILHSIWFSILLNNYTFSSTSSAPVVTTTSFRWSYIWSQTNLIFGNRSIGTSSIAHPKYQKRLFPRLELQWQQRLIHFRGKLSGYSFLREVSRFMYPY